MLNFLGISYHKNPTMSSAQAKVYLKELYKSYSYEKLASSLELHVS
jgi:hypothetical protein